jgi:uncharacterized membrane protein
MSGSRHRSDHEEKQMTQIGPVQLVAVGFGPDAKFEGRILEEIARLEDERTVRVLDLLFVSHDAESGELVVLDHQGEDLGAIVGALLGFEFEGAEPNTAGGDREDQHAFGLSQAEIEGLAGSIEPGHAAGFMLIEHVWARDLKTAIRDAGGVPLGEGFLTPEAVAAVAVELGAMTRALDEVEAEQRVGASA